MEENNLEKLSELLDYVAPTKENQEKIAEIKNLINAGNLKETMKKIDELFAENNMEIAPESMQQEKQTLTRVSKKETKKESKQTEEKYPAPLMDNNLEYTYIGLLLNHPKYISKYYFVYEDCLFANDDLLNIYKSVLFYEGAEFSSEAAKKDFNFSRDDANVYQYKQNIKMDVVNKQYNMEKIYVDLKKLFVLRKYYTKEPMESIQQRIVEIKNYTLYNQMSVEEVESAIRQVTLTQRFKQSILNTDLTKFLELGENNLTTGLSLPFPILNSVFKGIRKGETMAYAMPSNAGKSRFTINLAAYTAFVNQKKVLVMQEKKMAHILQRSGTKQHS